MGNKTNWTSGGSTVANGTCNSAMLNLSIKRQTILAVGSEKSLRPAPTSS